MKKSSTKKIDLSIVILSYNTQRLLLACLESIYKFRHDIKIEVLVVDNNSSDSSVAAVQRNFPQVKIIENDSNLGFAKGNNQARKKASGEYVLFLNSDTVVNKGSIEKSHEYLVNNPQVGAMSCKTVLPDGSLDKDTRRSFITPWIGLVHLFLRLDRLFPKSKLFGQYWYGYIDENTVHEVDALQGAFMMLPKKVLDEVDWFSPEYFLDGEDLDLCWKIKSKGYKIIYYPKVSITHFKGSSKGKTESDQKQNVGIKNKLKYRLAGVNSMQIFYRKFLWGKYPLIVNFIVEIGILLLKIIRVVKTLILG